MGIFCERCKIEMEQFSVEKEFSSETALLSGSEVLVGQIGVSGAKALGSPVEAQRIYYKCPKCKRIVRIDE